MYQTMKNMISFLTICSLLAHDCDMVPLNISQLDHKELNVKYKHFLYLFSITQSVNKTALYIREAGRELTGFCKFEWYL